MEFTLADITAFILAIFGGGGIGWVLTRLYIQNEAKKAVGPDLTEIKHMMDVIQTDIKSIESNYVQCKYCEMQYSGIHTLFESIDTKLNILLKKE